MGRIAENTRVKRKKRRDLQKIRNEALNAKQLLKKKKSPKGKSAYVNLLKDFAEKRAENENAKPSEKANGKPTIISEKLLPNVGLFKKGYKGDEIKNQEKLALDNSRQARLHGNFLQLMNGNEEKTKKFSNILNNIVDYSQNNSNQSTSQIASSPQNKRNEEIMYARKQEKGKDILPNVDINKFKTSRPKSIFDDDSDDRNVPKNNIQHEYEPIRFAHGLRRNRHLDVRKDIEVDRIKNRENGLSISHCRNTLSNVQLLKEFWTRSAKTLFSGLNLEGQSDMLKETKECLKTMYRKNWSRNVNIGQSESEFEVQACTGTTQSITLNAIFPELQDSQTTCNDVLKYSNKKSIYQNGLLTSSTESAVLSPTLMMTPSLKDLSQSKNKLLFSSVFNQSNDKLVHHNYANFGKTPQDSFSVDVNFSTSLKAMSIDSDSDDEHVGGGNILTRYLQDCRLRSQGNLDVFEELRGEPTRNQNQMRNPVYSPVNPHLQIPKHKSFMKNVHFMDSKMNNFGETFMKHQETDYTKKYERQMNQPIAKEVHESVQRTEFHNANFNPAQSNAHKYGRNRSSEERSRSRSSDGNASSHKLSGDKQMNSSTHNLSRQPSFHHHFDARNQHSMKYSQNSSGEKNRSHEVKQKSRGESIQETLERSDFLNQILPSSIKNSDKPTIVVVMPPVLHMHCDNVKNMSHANYHRVLSQPLYPHPVTCTATNDYDDNQRSAVLNEFVESSMSQPVKFVAVEEDEQRLKKPVYLSQDDNQSRRKKSFDNSRASFCCNRIPEDTSFSQQFCQRQHNYDLRNRGISKQNSKYEQTECFCSQESKAQDERQIRRSRRKCGHKYV